MPGSPPGGIELRYVGDRPERQGLIVWRTTPVGPVPSVANVSPLIGWYEREIADLFGATFAGHPEPHRLVLHEGAAPEIPPLDARYPANTPMPFTPTEGDPRDRKHRRAAIAVRPGARRRG